MALSSSDKVLMASGTSPKRMTVSVEAWPPVTLTVMGSWTPRSVLLANLSKPEWSTCFSVMPAASVLSLRRHGDQSLAVSEETGNLVTCSVPPSHQETSTVTASRTSQSAGRERTMHGGTVHILSGSQGTGLQGNTWAAINQSNLLGNGAVVRDAFGFAVATGDFNNDGFDDLAIGSPGEDANEGAVNVLYGSVAGITASGNQHWKIGKDGILGDGEPEDSFGIELAAGDVNGDGNDDLVIGAPGEAEGRGRVHVIFGSGIGLTGGGNQLWQLGTGGLPGVGAPADLFGSQIDIGDFNGDGFGDIAASSPGEDQASGSVTIIPGSSFGPTSTGSQNFRQGLGGIGDQFSENDQFGSTLAVGDFNFDGLSDLAIATDGEDEDAGIVQIVFGSVDGLNGEGSQLFGQGRGGLGGTAQADDFFGRALAAGNFGGDMADDLIIGSPGEDGGLLKGIIQTLLGNSPGPQINAIVSSGLGLPAITTLSPNTLATVFGEDLFPAGQARSVGASDLIGGFLPTIVDGTCLEINGKRTPLLFLRDDQVNFQVRADETGSFTFQMVRNCGGATEFRSNVVQVSIAPVSPDMLAAVIDPDGSKAVLATNVTTGKSVGPRSFGAQYEPAKAGDIITLWPTGLGLTTPPFAPGELPPLDASGAAPAAPVTVSIDGVPAIVHYAGSSPGFAGLYQINVTVPVTGSVGDVPISITSSGGGPAATTPANSSITVE